MIRFRINARCLTLYERNLNEHRNSMADVHTPAQRSYNMSRVRSKDTKPELIVRKFLHAHGFRYRLHDKKLPGKPDVVLPRYKTVIFVHGCRCAGLILPRPRRMPLFCGAQNPHRLVDGQDQWE